MIDPDERAIGDRAYLIWEREGRPNGRDRDHWLQAAWELAGEEARAAARKAAKSAGKNVAGKAGKGAGKRAKASK